MSFLLDTNIVSAHLRRPRGLMHRFVQYSGRLLVSTVSLAELHVWAQRAPDPEVRLRAIRHMLQYEVAALPYDEQSAAMFGYLQRTLQQHGVVINPVDLLIASVACAHDLTLVTHNVRHFKPISGLRIENWLAP